MVWLIIERWPDKRRWPSILDLMPIHQFHLSWERGRVSQSALSHTIRGLEARQGLRLLARTTRSVAPTEAGERLLRTFGPRFDEIEAELAEPGELRDKPAGTFRITSGEHAAEAILWPALAKLLPRYPDIKVESQRRLGPDGHRRGTLRRRRSSRRAGSKGHDRGSRRSRLSWRLSARLPISPDARSRSTRRT